MIKADEYEKVTWCSLSGRNTSFGSVGTRNLGTCVVYDTSYFFGSHSPPYFGSDCKKKAMVVCEVVFFMHLSIIKDCDDNLSLQNFIYSQRIRLMAPTISLVIKMYNKSVKVKNKYIVLL